jgi:HAD superfamily hydrolase (TIGR01509 family)
LTSGTVGAYFDLDGTLLDTTYLHTWARWRALGDAGISATMAEVHSLIGRSGDDLVATLAGAQDETLHHAHATYFAGMADLIRPLPGARELLEAVHARGFRLVIVTSAQEQELALLLAPLRCDDLIDEVVHGDAVGDAKPAPDIFELALDRSGTEPSSSVAIGDTVWDVFAARRAGMRCVAVETGGTAACALLAAGATAVYQSCGDLLEHLDTSPLGEVTGSGG